MNKYRSHNCSELRKKDVGNKVLLSGWLNKKRDHGNLLFMDLRDNYGITQCIINKENKYFSDLEKMQLETVIQINGTVVDRSSDTKNEDIDTGEIEVSIKSLYFFLIIKFFDTIYQIPDTKIFFFFNYRNLFFNTL